MLLREDVSNVFKENIMLLIPLARPVQPWMFNATVSADPRPCLVDSITSIFRVIHF